MSSECSDINLMPRVIPRAEHGISRQNISKAALKVLYRLHEGGFAAYLVGGSVRDLLLGGHPKDYDVVTDATPDEVRQLFSNSRIIGRRFRLVHVRYGPEIIEVATFRGNAAGDDAALHTETGIILRDNVFGSMEDDAIRRDFTVNALYYNIADFSVVDYLDGMDDLKQGVMRVIGDPETRYREDPVRMLRAVRLASKLNFAIDAESADIILAKADMINHVPQARLFDEVLKMITCGSVEEIYANLQHFGFFNILFPATAKAMAEDETGFYQKFLAIALQETDARLEEGRSINPAFLLGVILWMPLQRAIAWHESKGLSIFQAMVAAESDVLNEQRQIMSMPKRMTFFIREVWKLQYHLPQQRRVRMYRTLNHPRFRAAYDFLLLRDRAGESLTALCEWWTAIQDANPEEQDVMILERQSKGGRHGRKRR